VSPGDRVRVRVLEANVEKGQISLSMRVDGRGEAGAGRSAERRHGRGSRPGGDEWRDRARAADSGKGRDDRANGAGRGSEARVESPTGEGGPRHERPWRGDRPREHDRRRADERRDERPNGPRAAGPGSGAPRGGQGRRPAEPFNNPFAKLVAMRDAFKPKP
jgi:ATP-dependent RNA helicase SUPV3L1/SUV3